MKKQFAILLSVLLLASMLFGCSANDKASMEMGNAAPMEDMAVEGTLSSTSGSTGAPKLENQKLVRKIYLDAETEEMDSLLKAIDEKIAALSGYVEAREVYNGSEYSGRRYRYADITIRIPADQLDSFVAHVTENANITSTNETTDNITLSYVATQSRVTALETEQARLLELLAQAESMEDLLKIEKRLTEVRTELEEVASQLRLFDNMVNYGTVYLNISEVREYTVVDEPETMWERMGTGFVNSVKNVVNILKELAIFFVTAIPYLMVPVLFVIVVLVVVRVWIAAAKRKRKKNTEEVKKDP